VKQAHSRLDRALGHGYYPHFVAVYLKSRSRTGANCAKAEHCFSWKALTPHLTLSSVNMVLFLHEKSGASRFQTTCDQTPCLCLALVLQVTLCCEQNSNIDSSFSDMSLPRYPSETPRLLVFAPEKFFGRAPVVFRSCMGALMEG
jgi:hypothetical protein